MQRSRSTFRVSKYELVIIVDTCGSFGVTYFRIVCNDAKKSVNGNLCCWRTGLNFCDGRMRRVGTVPPRYEPAFSTWTLGDNLSFQFYESLNFAHLQIMIRVVRMWPRRKVSVSFLFLIFKCAGEWELRFSSEIVGFYYFSKDWSAWRGHRVYWTYIYCVVKSLLTFTHGLLWSFH